MSKFKYLGLIITDDGDDDDDLSAVELKLSKARAPWGRIGKIKKKGKQIRNRKYLVSFIKWLYKFHYYMDQEDGWFNAFHGRCAQFMKEKHISTLDVSTWVNPATKESMELSDSLAIEDYIKKRENYS